MDLDLLKAHDYIGQKSAGVVNYIYVMLEKRVVDVNITFIYKDVEKYTGFASFGTELKVTYFDENGLEQYKVFTAGYLAEEQVCTVRVLAETDFEFMVTCENDSVVSKVVYLSDSVRVVNGNFAHIYINLGMLVLPEHQFIMGSNYYGIEKGEKGCNR